jgi:hypothetical protein
LARQAAGCGAARVGAGSVVAAPVNTEKPFISGSFVIGETLFGNVGTWINNPTSFTYQWMQALTDDSGAVLTDELGNPLGAVIVGATSINYVLQNSDLGETVFLEVTAFNTDGSAWADSFVFNENTPGAGAITSTNAIQLPVNCWMPPDINTRLTLGGPRPDWSLRRIFRE